MEDVCNERKAKCSKKKDDRDAFEVAFENPVAFAEGRESGTKATSEDSPALHFRSLPEDEIARISDALLKDAFEHHNTQLTKLFVHNLQYTANADAVFSTMESLISECTLASDCVVVAVLLLPVSRAVVYVQR